MLPSLSLPSEAGEDSGGGGPSPWFYALAALGCLGLLGLAHIKGAPARHPRRSPDQGANPATGEESTATDAITGDSATAAVNSGGRPTTGGYLSSLGFPPGPGLPPAGQPPVIGGPAGGQGPVSTAGLADPNLLLQHMPRPWQWHALQWMSQHPALTLGMAASCLGGLGYLGYQLYRNIGFQQPRGGSEAPETDQGSPATEPPASGRKKIRPLARGSGERWRQSQKNRPPRGTTGIPGTAAAESKADPPVATVEIGPPRPAQSEANASLSLNALYDSPSVLTDWGAAFQENLERQLRDELTRSSAKDIPLSPAELQAQPPIDAYRLDALADFHGHRLHLLERAQAQRRVPPAEDVFAVILLERRFGNIAQTTLAGQPANLYRTTAVRVQQKLASRLGWGWAPGRAIPLLENYIEDLAEELDPSGDHFGEQFKELQVLHQTLARARNARAFDRVPGP